MNSSRLYPPPKIPPFRQSLPWRRPDFSRAPAGKFEREYRTFWLMLPELLTTHCGHFVAIHEGQVVDTRDNRVELAMRARDRFGYVPIFVGRVEESQPIVRIPSFRTIINPKERATYLETFNPPAPPHASATPPA